MPLSIPMRSARWLALLPLIWLACSDHESLSSITGGTTGAGGYGTTTATSSGSANGGGATGGASSSASTGGSGGASSSASGGATGGASSSSSTAGSSATSSSSSSSGTGGEGGGLTGTRMRLVAANLSTGNNQSYDPGEGLRILQGIHGDVVMMQEMNYGANSAAELQGIVTTFCGAECTYTRGTGEIPNAVVSRYPILNAGTWTDADVTNRDFVWARLDVPGPVDLWVISVHLLTTSAGDRDDEAAQLVALIDANVPAGDFVVLGGDFNTATTAEQALTTFGERLSVAPPYPADGDGNANTNGPRTRPHDWVLPSAELRAREVPVVIGASHFDAGLVVDTRVYSPIADLAPALAGDSGANGMQHMAVLKDFLLVE